jgi:hypothetical protein
MRIAIDPSTPSEALQSLTLRKTANSPTISIHQKDTIGQAVHESSTYQPSKPRLSPPNCAIEYKVLSSLDNISEVGGGWLQVQNNMLDDCSEKIREIQKQNIEKLNEAAKNAQKNDLWSLIKKVGAFILAAVSTVFGISLMATGAGTVVGAAMVTSGIMTVTNIAFSETGVWDWVAEKLAKDNKELQKKIATFLPCAVGVVSAVVGLAGSGAALAWTSLSLVQKGLLIIQTALNLAEGTLTVVEGVNDFKSLRTRADLNEIKRNLFVQQNKLEKITGGMEKYMKLISHATDEAAKAIKLSISGKQKIIIQG